VPRYSYFAKNLTGEPRSGLLEAKNKHDLARVLRQEGCFLISAISEEEMIAKKKFVLAVPFLNKVSLKEKIIFTRNLKVMISAGISLPRSLKILAGQSKSKKLKRTLLEISEEIIEGKNFSESLVKHPAVFPEFFCSMIKVGEEAGTMESVLGVLTRQMERDYELRSKIKGAMIYPIIILITMFVIGILMLIIVVPRLSETFVDLNIQLPFTTRVVILVGNLLAKFWYLVPLILVGLAFFLRLFSKTKRGKKLFDTFFVRAPFISSVIKQINSAYTVRTLSSLIASGIPLVRALEVTAGTLSNGYYKEAINEAAEQVRKGAKLSEALKRHENIYPVLVNQMVEVGEETGETSGILEKLAEFFEEEVATTTKNLSVIIEPALMLIVGAAVGFFAVSIIQPIYSMMQGIK
jgi:type IV pilus assembly protein PilC